jgi:hypothetical protein
MAGPWEKYAAPAQDGPWAKYSKPQVAPEQPAAVIQEPQKLSNLEAMKATVENGLGFFGDLNRSFHQLVGNTAAGAVRGAGSIGATVVRPFYNESSQENDQRRAAMDSALAGMGAQPDSLAYGAGKLGAEIAGTSGVGGALAKGVGAIPGVAQSAPGLVEAIRTAGMSAGAGQGAVANTLTRAAGGALTGGAMAGLVNPEDTKTGAVIGGAFPVVTKVAGEAGKAVGNALRSTVSPEVATLAKRAKELGVDIPADRLANSKPLDAVASGLNYVPFSGRAATEAKMNSQLNQALSKTFGQDSSNVTMALRKAGDKLGGEFDRVLTTNGVKVDPQFMDDIANVYNKATEELGSDALKPITSKLNDLIAKGSSGVIDGKAAYNIKRDLDRIGRSNTPTAWHALELKQKLMEALNRSLGPEQAAAFATTRQQYGNMLSLEKLAKNGVEGELSVARIANMKNINNNQLQEIADIAAQFVKPREGQHGAMQRAIVGLGGAAVGGAPGLAAGAAAGRATNMLLNSNSLRNAMLGEKSQNSLVELAMSPEVRQLAYRSGPVISGQ